MYGGMFGLDFIGDKSPNLGQNKSFKRGQDYVKGETKIGGGKASSSSLCSSFPRLLKLVVEVK